MIDLSPRNEEMNDHLSLLSQGYAAKRALAALFQSEFFGQAKQPPITIAAHEPIHAVQRGVKQASKLFRENRRPQGLLPNRTPSVLGRSQPDQRQRDLTVSGFVFALVSVGVILAAYTDRPIFLALIGPAPFGVLQTIRTFLRQRLRRQEQLLEIYERERNLQTLSNREIPTYDEKRFLMTH
jgi:hypothetical protein